MKTTTSLQQYTIIYYSRDDRLLFGCAQLEQPLPALEKLQESSMNIKIEMQIATRETQTV